MTRRVTFQPGATGARSVSVLWRRSQVLHPQLPSCDQFAVVFPLDFDEPNLLGPTSEDGRADGSHWSGPMRTEEIGGVRHADDSHAARDLAGRDRGPMTAHGLNYRGPYAAVNDAVRLLVPFIDIDVSHDPRWSHLLDSES
jgi:hypothetical protein